MLRLASLQIYVFGLYNFGLYRLYCCVSWIVGHPIHLRTTFILCSRFLRVRFPRNRWHCNSGRPPDHMLPGGSAYSRDTNSSASATHSVDVLLPRPDSLAQRRIHDERLAGSIPLLERYKQPHQVRHHPSEQVLSSHIQVSSVGRKSIEELRRGLADAFQVMDRGFKEREEGVIVRRSDTSSS